MTTPPLPEPIPSPAADEVDPTAILEFEPTGSAPVHPRAIPRRTALLAGGAALAVVAIALSIAFFVHRRHRVADGIVRATALVRQDTAAGYADADALLAPLARIDPLEAGALRAFALAMRALDYRDAAAAAEAERLLVAPGRAAQVPTWAELATAALALSRREMGTATTAAGHAAGSAWSDVLQARTALLAGNLAAAAESAAAAATQDPALPAARALEGDAARKARDGRRAKAAYDAALAASPEHARATFGLAKLALAGLGPAGDARAALQRLAYGVSVPAPERAHAAVHLAALRLRAGDRAGADTALAAARLDAAGRAWAERAAAVEAIAPRATPPAPPAALRSPSDEG